MTTSPQPTGSAWPTPWLDYAAPAPGRASPAGWDGGSESHHALPDSPDERPPSQHGSPEPQDGSLGAPYGSPEPPYRSPGPPYPVVPQPAPGTGPPADADRGVGVADIGAAQRTEGHLDHQVGEYVAMPGLPARGVIVVSLVAAAACAAADLFLTGRLTMFFDLCFIVVCLVGAMAVRRRDFFTTGVLPPLLFAAVVAGLAFRDPETFVQAGGLGKAFMTGLAQHATALVTGYAIALAALACRLGASRLR